LTRETVQGEGRGEEFKCGDERKVISPHFLRRHAGEKVRGPVINVKV